MIQELYTYHGQYIKKTYWIKYIEQSYDNDSASDSPFTYTFHKRI